MTSDLSAAPPSVSILGKPRTGQFTLREDSELALVCLAGGEPRPAVSWRREGQTLPDGSLSGKGSKIPPQ